MDRTKRLPWILLAAWILVIFATVPLVRRMQLWIRDTVGSEVFAYAVIAAVVVAVSGGVAAVVRARRRAAPSTLLWLVAIAAVYVWWTLRLWKMPEEAVHLLEYGILGVLAYWALRQRAPDTAAFVAAALLGTAVGTVDEIIQWITPERYWDWRDIAINSGASALIQLALWKAVPRQPAPPRPSSWRLVCRLAAVELVLLALCLANTPARVEWYASRVPALGSLASNQNAMNEFGYLHADEEIGRFRSRFTLAELDSLDSSRGREAGAILDAYPEALYGEFLSAFPPGRDPFVHEARVHLFSRDRNLGLARERREVPDHHRAHMTRAVRENRILEACFAVTIAHSSSRWNARRLAKVEQDSIDDFQFTSMVSAHLVTSVAEWQLQLVIALALVGLAAAHRRLGRLEDRR